MPLRRKDLSCVQPATQLAAQQAAQQPTQQGAHSVDIALPSWQHSWRHSWRHSRRPRSTCTLTDHQGTVALLTAHIRLCRIVHPRLSAYYSCINVILPMVLVGCSRRIFSLKFSQFMEPESPDCGRDYSYTPPGRSWGSRGRRTRAS